MCCLHIPVSSDLFVLQTDASYRVLRDGMELPVGFYSRKVNKTRYSASEFECLAVVDSVKTF